VYLCLTCPEARGLCSACSIACHTDHEQVELYVPILQLRDMERFLKSSFRFPKRTFRCDCPTTAIAHRCTLHQIMQEENTSNRYGQNFKGDFCRCERPYDAKKEREAMIQCLACEVRSSPSYTASRNHANSTLRIGFTNPAATCGIDHLPERLLLSTARKNRHKLKQGMKMMPYRTPRPRASRHRYFPGMIMKLLSVDRAYPRIQP